MEGDAISRESLRKVINELLKEGKTVEVPVFGYSMVPFLKPGVTVRITPVVLAHIKRGDVLFFDNGGQMVLHRVLKIEQNGWLCRGDSLVKHDPLVMPTSVFGVLEGWQCRTKWRMTTGWRFQICKALALFGGWVYPFCSRLVVRAAVKLALF